MKGFVFTEFIEFVERRHGLEQLELERDEAQELPMLLRPGSVGDGGAEDPEEHEQLSAGTAGRGRDVNGLSATRTGPARVYMALPTRKREATRWYIVASFR